MSDEQLITEEDVNGFKRQIEQWSEGLSDGERAVLQMVLVRAFGPEDDVMGFDATAPRDAASGLPTGKRMHAPFVIKKTVDASSPVFYKGLIGTSFNTE